jgi:hypothetical protein
MLKMLKIGRQYFNPRCVVRMYQDGRRTFVEVEGGGIVSDDRPLENMRLAWERAVNGTTDE